LVVLGFWFTRFKSLMKLTARKYLSVEPAVAMALWLESATTGRYLDGRRSFRSVQ
jgi:hypothetical protein